MEEFKPQKRVSDRVNLESVFSINLLIAIPQLENGGEAVMESAWENIYYQDLMIVFFFLFIFE